MADTPEIPESDLWELDAAFNAMEDEVALNRRVFEATEKALGEIARRFYPGISNWEPEQLSRLADRIVRAAHTYCIDLCNLDHASARAKE
jgi:hypothetical protein